MGVEGKDRAKVLEAGAASLSNQLGVAVQRLRKSYGLSLADLSTGSGVAKSIISQIERNETNPTLATIWRLAHALDVSIVSMLQGGEDGPFIEHLRPGTTPIFVSDDGLCRLAVIGWLKTVDWLQWYDFQADPGGVLESAAHARGSIECLSALEGELEVDVGGAIEVVGAGETLRYRCDRPHRIRNLGQRPAHATMVNILKAAKMD
jgi:transcriptional regulator with XRE-family HTH domain